jgi:HEAT repeat protein
VAYTEALASAIPQLSADSQLKARDALAERLMRMNAATLRARLRDTNPELRAAAARACAGKEDLEQVPLLIQLLEDKETMVVRAARSALRHLARGKDYGPVDDSNPADRGKAIDEWKKWWAAQRPR